MGRTLRKTYWLIQVFILNVYGSGLLSWDDLCEVVLDIEVSLNHRPLSYVEDDPQFPTLKPSSLLFLNANILPELEPYRLEDRDLRKRAKFLKATVFEKAAQLSVLVYDNKLNDRNNEAFSTNTVCNCRSRYDKFVYFNCARTHGIRVCDREPSRIPKKRISRILERNWRNPGR